MPPDIYKRMFLPSDLEEAMEDTLAYWFPAYLTHMETVLALPVGSLKVPANYTTRNKFDALPGEELPKVVIICPGLAAKPTMDGSKQLNGLWSIGVGVAVSAPTEEDASFKSKLYGTVAMAIVMHHPDLGGVANDTWVVNEQFNDLPISGQIRQYRAASIEFQSEVPNIVTKYAGPKNPADVYGTANKVITTIQKIKVG